MIKSYFILFAILVPCIFAQSCIKCKQGACTPQGCTACQDGFMLNSVNQCGLFTPVEGCTRYDAYYGNCISCDARRVLIGQRCLPKPDNCDTTDSNRECLKCISGFVLVRGNCYTQTIRNCPLGTLPSIIQNQNNVVSFCQPLRPQNCKSMNQNKICTQCQTGFTLANGRCLKFNSNSIACPKNQCRCPPGFFPFNERCLQLSIDKCTLIRADGIYCSACSRGFVAIQGVCLQPVKQDDINCNVKAPLSDYCTGCNQDYFLNDEAFCVREFNFVTNCTVNSKFIRQKNGRCVYIDSRCDAVNQTDLSCIRCQEGFEINQNSGRCQRIVCIGYSANGICNQVFQGYQISADGKSIIRLPANCIRLVPGTNQCAQCSNFTKNISNRCVYEDRNCLQYNLNGFCMRCFNETQREGYLLVQRFCSQKATNCLTRQQNDQLKCKQCLFNYHLDVNDRRCYINITGCEIYQRQSFCKQCLTNFLLYDRRCLSVNTSCLDLNSGVCRRCQEGLLPFGNSCVFFHPYCIQYGSDGVCTRAHSGWSTGSGMNAAQKLYYIQFIKRGEVVRSRNGAVNLQGLVTNVGAGEYSRSGGAIIQIIPYANILHSKVNSVNMYGQIVSCKQGFTKVGNLCLARAIQGCELYHPNQNCLRCSPGFTLNANFTCSNGLVCNQAPQNGRCVTCGSGTINIGSGQCFRIENKIVVDNLLKDSFNFFRYQVGNGVYVAWPRSPNCRDQSEPYRCSICNQRYQLVNSQCRIVIPNCNNYGQNSMAPGLCQGCQNGFVLWFSQCIRLSCVQSVNGTCQTCPVNFYYYFGVCLNNPLQNCRMMQNNVCVLCLPRFYLNAQNQCAQEVANCLTTNRDTGRCLQCRFSFTLYKDSCVREIRYCQDYDLNSNRCTRCQQNSVNRTQLLSNGQCALLEGQCRRVDQTTRQCNQCNQGYTNVTQNGSYLCVMLRQNCRTYDIRGRCTACNQRFVLQSNQCRTYILYCLVYDDERNLTCKTCDQSTILQLPEKCCKKPDNNCRTYDQCYCTNCTSRFHLNDVGLCQSNPVGCEIYDFYRKRCTLCQPSYYLTNDECLPQNNLINGCEERDQTSKVTFRCRKCRNGFILNMTDGLCYGFNCPNRRSEQTRKCLSCPTFYKLYTPNSFRPEQTFCIPQFCQDYVPIQSKCRGTTTIVQQSFSINTQTTQIIIIHCINLNYPNKRCLQCRDLRYPSQNTPYGLCYPYNCNSTQQFNCQRCKFGFGPNPNTSSQTFGTCIALNCLTINPKTGRCQACQNQFTLNRAQGTCENRGCCESFDQTRNTCIVAKKYFTIQNGICLPRSCIKIDPVNITRCIQCHKGYLLVGDGTCRPKFCRIQAIAGERCSLCIPGFMNSIVVSTQRSICQPNNCFIISEDGSYCEKCNEGFTLNALKLCISDFCVQFDNETLICSKCQPYYKLQNQRCIADCVQGSPTTCKCCGFDFALNITTGLCQPVMNFCIKNTIADICQVCADGYVLNSASKCVKKTPFCITPGRLGCAKCQPGFQLVRNCFCRARDCNRWNQNGSCIECHKRFQLTPELLCRPRDCKFFSVQNWGCNTCFTRFFSKETKCVARDCQEWQDAQRTICKKCGSITYNSKKKFDMSGLRMPLELVNGGCYTKYCKIDPREATCDQCYPGYVKTYQQTCQCQNISPDGSCNCPKDYIYDPKLDYCVPNKDVCLQRSNDICFLCPFIYQKINGQCIPFYCQTPVQRSPYYYECQKCYPDFNLRNGFCQNSLCLKYENKTSFPLPQCVQCPNGWKPYNNYCVPARCVPDFYFIYNASCTKCTFGYESINGICQVSNCRVPRLPDSCSECDYGFEYSNNLCLARNCSQFYDNSTECKACLKGFYLFEKKCLASFCQIFNTDLICQQCWKDFSFRPLTLKCSRLNCEVDNDKICEQCQKGFRYNATFKNCVAVNCIRYFPNFTCQTCIQDFYRQNGTCIDVLCQLQSFNKQFSCTQCQQGYNFNSNRKCMPDPSDFCPAGRYFINGTCVNIPTPGCRMFVSKRCVWCQQFFFLQNGLCYPTQSCSRFSYYFGCYQCPAQFILDSRQCRRIQNDANCKRYRQNRCIECNENLQIAQNGLCVRPIPNCRVIQQEGICRECQAGYSGQRCQNRNDPNCNRFDNSLRCVECRKGFYVNIQGRCIQNPIYCQVARPDGKCTLCQNGRDLQDGACYPRIPFCMRYFYDTRSNNTVRCIICRSGFTLADNYCRCPPGTQLIPSQKCEQLPQNCVRMDQTTFICLQCAPNYELRPDNSCQNNTVKPQPIPNCIRYDSSGRNCQQCDQNFILINNNCVPCPSGRVKVGNQCVIPGPITPPFCTSFNQATGICNQCDRGYTLTPDSRSCVTIILFCVAYSNFGSCVQCQSGYFITNNGASCQANRPPIPIPDPIPDSGSTCFSQSGIQGCQRCKHRYYLDSQMCSAYIPYCINIDINGACISCCFGSTLVNRTCQKDPVIRYCARQAGNTCLQCQPNYYYCQFCDACLPASPNCNQYNSFGDCVKCIDNFILLNGVCISPPVGEVWGAAGTCRSDYYLKNGNCFRNDRTLRLLSQIIDQQPPLARSAAPSGSLIIEPISVYSQTVVILFGIIITSSQPLGQNTNYILYYRSKRNDPMVCWNSCIPTRIDSQNYLKELNQPIVAVQINVFILNRSRRGISVDYKVL